MCMLFLKAFVTDGCQNKESFLIKPSKFSFQKWSPASLFNLSTVILLLATSICHSILLLALASNGSHLTPDEMVITTYLIFFLQFSVLQPWLGFQWGHKTSVVWSQQLMGTKRVEDWSTTK